MKVILNYFKTGGKWYSEGDYITELKHLHEIHEEVRAMNEYGGLPGLVKESRHWIILIDVPKHEHNHPRLIVPTKQIVMEQLSDKLFPDER